MRISTYDEYIKENSSKEETVFETIDLQAIAKNSSKKDIKANLKKHLAKSMPTLADDDDFIEELSKNIHFD